MDNPLTVYLNNIQKALSKTNSGYSIRYILDSKTGLVKIVYYILEWNNDITSKYETYKVSNSLLETFKNVIYYEILINFLKYSIFYKSHSLKFMSSYSKLIS